MKEYNLKLEEKDFNDLKNTLKTTLDECEIVMKRQEETHKLAESLYKMIMERKPMSRQEEKDKQEMEWVWRTTHEEHLKRTKEATEKVEWLKRILGAMFFADTERPVEANV